MLHDPPDVFDDESYLAQVGVRLREKRHALGLTLKEVEVATGSAVTASSLGHYERGSRHVSLPKLFRLAQLYQVRPSALLDDSGTAGGPPGGQSVDTGPMTVVANRPQMMVLSTSAVFKCAATGVEPVQRLLRAVPPADRRTSYTVPAEQLRHLAVIYELPTVELVTMFQNWGIIDRWVSEVPGKWSGPAVT